MYQEYARGVSARTLRQRYGLSNTSFKRIITRFEELGRRLS